MTAPREIDKSDQRARRAMWEDFFTRRCPTARDVINSAVGALVLRDAQTADLEGGPFGEAGGGVRLLGPRGSGR